MEKKRHDVRGRLARTAVGFPSQPEKGFMSEPRLVRCDEANFGKKHPQMQAGRQAGLLGKGLGVVESLKARRRKVRKRCGW